MFSVYEDIDCHIPLSLKKININTHTNIILQSLLR